MKHVSIIMPAFDEGGHIYDNIRMTREVMLAAGLEAEIVAVDDGSGDDTLAGIERAAADFDDVVVARNPYNMGKGMALRTGFDYSSGDIVVFLDADLDLHPSQIQALIGILEEAPYDIVVTSKHHPDSQLDYPWFRKVASWVYYMLIKLMFGLPVRDTQTGLKVFRRRVLETVFHRLLVKKFAYDVELLAVAVRFGYKVHEIPVVLDFKRQLSWGRIRVEDVLRIFIDTLAVFYRLRILRYYDAERPPMPRENIPVLVVVRGCPPPGDVVERLSLDTNTSIACISRDYGAFQADIMFFSDDDGFGRWIERNSDRYSIVGFLEAGCLPLGSWVKNAVRNFESPDIAAVCGPMIPGPFDTRLGMAAGMTFSSLLTAGPESHLYSIARMRNVTRGPSGNVFLRSSCFKAPGRTRSVRFNDGIVTITASDGSALRYDPDVAVSKPVPPLFLPYLSMAARDSFSRGRASFSAVSAGIWFWNLVRSIVVCILLTGWLVLPSGWYAVLVVLYLALVAATGLSCFDLSSAPLFMAGIMLDHLVRGCAFPAGLVARLFKRPEKR